MLKIRTLCEKSSVPRVSAYTAGSYAPGIIHLHTLFIYRCGSGLCSGTNSGITDGGSIMLQKVIFC